MPWKNGGGITHEIALEPDPEHPGYPLWRLSMATIAQDGPFSDFAGYDRTIVSVDGNGAELTFDGGITAMLDRMHQSISFSGEAHVQCRIVDGPVRDFNVMTRRDRFLHNVAFAQAPEGALFGSNAASFVVILNGSAVVDGEVATALDTIVVLPDAGEIAAGPGGLHACIVSLSGVG